MSDRFAYIIQEQPLFSFARLIAGMRKYGVDLPNPRTGEIRCLTPEGEGVSASARDIEEWIRAGWTVSFELWTENDDDLVCCVKTERPLLTEWYSFSNPESTAGRLVDLFLDRFAAVHEAGGLLLGVLDMEGVTAEFDWDGFQRQPRDLPPGASLVALPRARAAALSIPPGYQQIVRGDLLILCAVDIPNGAL